MWLFIVLWIIILGGIILIHRLKASRSVIAASYTVNLCIAMIAILGMTDTRSNQNMSVVLKPDGMEYLLFFLALIGGCVFYALELMLRNVILNHALVLDYRFYLFGKMSFDTFMISVVISIMEEIVYRYFLTHSYKMWQLIVLLLIQAVCFGMNHISYSRADAVSKTVLGLILGILCITTQSMFVTLAAHLSYNFFACKDPNHLIYPEKRDKKIPHVTKGGKGMSQIVITDLTKIYQGKKVLDAISLQITKPGIYLIAGPNGSGKTTLLEILAGLRKSSDGTVSINGFEPNSYQAKCSIGFLSQQNCLRKNCYVNEELKLICQLYGLKDIDPVKYLERYGLESYYHFKTKKLSGGSKRRLLLCMTFLPQQNIAILDEPVSGLDTFSRNEIWNMITEVAENKIVLVSDHYLNQAAQYADYIYLLDAGKIIAQGNVEELMKTIPKTHVIKVRKGKQESVEQMLTTYALDYDLKISGTVYNYYLSDRDQHKINALPHGEYVLNPIDFEDVYFYYTGKYSYDGGDTK